MKQMKVPRGTARAKRRETFAEPSDESKKAARAARAAIVRSQVLKLVAVLFHKAATAKLSLRSPFA